MPVDGQNSGPQWLLDVLAHPPGGREEGRGGNGKGEAGKEGGGRGGHFNSKHTPLAGYTQLGLEHTSRRERGREGGRE